MNPTRFEMMRSDPNCIWHGDGEVVENHTLLTIEDEGAGKYAVLSCCNYAFDTLAEFDEWVGKVRAAIKMGLGVCVAEVSKNVVADYLRQTQRDS